MPHAFEVLQLHQRVAGSVDLHTAEELLDIGDFLDAVSLGLDDLKCLRKLLVFVDCLGAAAFGGVEIVDSLPVLGVDRVKRSFGLL